MNPTILGLQAPGFLNQVPTLETPWVQVPNNHILSKILTYITTILKPRTSLLGPLDRDKLCQVHGT